MTALRFHRALYSGKALDEAMTRLGEFATYERAVEGDYWAVRVIAKDPRLQRTVVGELANHALGLTVERGAAQEPEDDA